MIRALFALTLVVAASAGAVEITDANYEAQLSSGKNAFIKFLAPWCGHCKSMKPAWDQLGSEYAASGSVLIGDADCTVEKAVCDKFEVRGYPTIKYFKDGDKKGQDYQGGRDFDTLKKFVEDELEVKCDINNLAECSDKAKKFVESMKTKGVEAIKAQIERLNGMAGKSMKADLKQWLFERLHLLKQLAAGGEAAGKEEL